MYTAIIIGGGAAGLFAAANTPDGSKILVLEQYQKLLSKVKISGGGRCNVTHSCFDPRQLVQYYPRGSKELLGPFTRFQPKDTIDWFAQRGVKLKTEPDGRMFPITDDSQTIIDCILKTASDKNVEIKCNAKVISAIKTESGFKVKLKSGEIYESTYLMLATGNAGHQLAQSFGHTIIDPVPSLFTFNIPNSPLHELSGVAVTDAQVLLPRFNKSYRGPLLITHWGFSGPAVLKLSAFCARDLHDCDYKTECLIDWIPNITEAMLKEIIQEKDLSKKSVFNEPLTSLPKNLWKGQLNRAHLDENIRWNQLSKVKKQEIIDLLKKDRFAISGKTTYKEEFVTCGGVKLSEINFKSMESRLTPGLFFGGEILDIDGITGGFNFQAAWTGGFLAAQAFV